MIFTKLGTVEAKRDAISRCSGNSYCAAVSSCGSGFDTAGINAYNYEAVKKANTPSA